MPAPFRFDRRFGFAVAAEDLWGTVTRTDQYQAWWPWLREFEGEGLEAGSVAHCVIQAPLPYSLRFSIEVTDLEEGRRVQTMVRGDLDGPASLEIEPDGDGACAARLQWELDLRDRLLRPMAAIGRPAMVWAHDRVIATGLRAFEKRALDGRRG